MDRTDKVAAADAVLRRADTVFGRCLALAEQEEPYLAEQAPAIREWSESMGPWRDGTAGHKRLIALAARVDAFLQALESGFEGSRAEGRAARLREREARADTAAREARQARMNAQREIVRFQSVRDRALQHEPATLFRQGTFDLRESGPG